MHIILPDARASSDPVLIDVVCRELQLGPRKQLLVQRTSTAIALAFNDESFPASLANINRILACGGFGSSSAPYTAFNGKSLMPSDPVRHGAEARKRRKPTISVEDAEEVHQKLLLRSLGGNARFVEFAIGRAGGNRTLKCAVDLGARGLLPCEIADVAGDPQRTLDGVIVTLLHYAGPDVSFVSRSDADVRGPLRSGQLGHKVHWTGRVSPAFIPDPALGVSWAAPNNNGIISIGDAVASAAQHHPNMPAIFRLADGREFLAAMPPGSTHCYLSCGPGPRRPRYDRMKRDIAFLERPGRPFDDFPLERFRVVADGHEAQYSVFTRMILLACHLPVWLAHAMDVPLGEEQDPETELDTNEEGQ